MQIAIISSIPELQYCDEGDMYMCLAQLCLQSKEYKEFFIERAKQGKFVILDNGVAEGEQVDPATLIELAVEMGVSEVIAPDTLYDGIKTREATLEFCAAYGYYLLKSGINIMGVVQGKTLHDAICTSKVFEDDPRITTIGLAFAGYDYLSFNSINKTQRNAHSRLWMFNCLNNLTPAIKKPIHLLGLYNPYELAFYKDLGEVRSCDSSSPVLCGLRNLPYLSYGIKEKPPTKFDFKSEVASKVQRAIIENNIKNLKEWADGTNTR